MENKEKLHVAMFPWLAYGHLMPFLEVATFLAQKGHRISFISTPKNLQKLPANLPPSITLVELPLPRVHGLPDSAESTSELLHNMVPYLKKAYDMLEPAVAEFLANSDVDWVIQDFMSFWLPQKARRLGVKSAFFSIFSATTLVFCGPPSLLIDSRARAKAAEDLTVVPPWVTYPTKVAFRLHEVINEEDMVDSDANMSVLQRVGRLIQGCEIVATRTCSEFEAEPLSLLKKLYGRAVVPMGLLPPQNKSRHEGDGRWSELKQWLDDREEKSVFYIALGTEVALSQELMHQLACGIEKSGLPFVWVVGRKAGPGSIPSGFESRVLGRGFVWVGWAPQLDILAHPSVGGFLTHCGWSSVIEALGQGRALIVFSGGSSDQGLVARLMDERRVGSEVPRNDRDGSFMGDSVAKTIRRVMVEPEGEEVRANAWAMREIFGNVELQHKYLEEFAQVLEEGRATS
ncbi:hypothetical protein EUGRSUZ_C00861 [Eucalyptus grandis]|uniref:Uncharacterized protein n=2 Tax=Eucalyptus grandis TaxID=71139 RepID=A0ACC3LBV9_EUCGR|nr:hypothetical protein EUGRSUZ_C00861 [Eucalyptus grandis]